MTATLFEYQQQVERFLRDQKQELINPADILTYINRARREVAMRTDCVRMLTPISGSIASVSITAVGSGYTTNPTITVTAPDFPSGGTVNPNGLQATITGTATGGTISATSIIQTGAGYFQPTASITHSVGTGASISLTVGGVNHLITGQEVYKFSDVDISSLSGVDSIFMIKSISILYSNFRYSLPCYAFSEYQAKLRRYPLNYQWVPTCCSQFGQGANGSFFVYPKPGANYAFELDCFMVPSDLTTNLSVEAIPMPWTEAVPWMAAYYCFLEIANFNVAKFYLDQFDMFVSRYSTYARPGRAVNPYGRYIWWLAIPLLEALQQLGQVIV